MIRFLSVCSGIEAASVATASLGWKAVAFSEIEPFPSAVLAHHWPDVPNLSDMTKYNDWPTELRFDLLCGGTPCQGFSVAGLRGGLDDPRSQLSLNFVEIAAKYRPEWLVWENVPGVLSSEGGADFANILAALTGREICIPQDGWGNSGHVEGIPEAYGVAWRVLDAQYFGVAQRRRRVFVIGHLGDWRRAAAVLFERDSLQGNPPPSREKREGTAENAGGRSHWSGGPHPSLNQSHNTVGIGMSNQELFSQEGAGIVPARMVAFGEYVEDDTASTMKSRDHKDATDLVASFDEVARPLTARHDSSPCADREMDVIAVNTGQGFYKEDDKTGTIDASPRTHHESNLLCVHGTQDPCTSEDTAFALGRNSGQENAVMIQNPDKVYSIAENIIGRQDYNGGNSKGFQEDIAYTLNTVAAPAVAFAQNSRDELRLVNGDGAIVGALSAEPGMKQTSFIKQATAVRRLTPTECERLQGFPDGHTLIPWRGKPANQCPDGPRYKALGNSWEVPCFLWIAERIQKISNL